MVLIDAVADDAVVVDQCAQNRLELSLQVHLHVLHMQQLL